MNIRNTKGQALVELALSLTLLLMIVFGVVELGRMLYVTNTLNNAAREAARRAVVSPVPLPIAALRAVVTGLIPFDQTGLTVAINPVSPAPGTAVNVRVVLPFRPQVQLLSMLRINLTGTATMRYE